MNRTQRALAAVAVAGAALSMAGTAQAAVQQTDVPVEPSMSATLSNGDVILDSDVGVSRASRLNMNDALVIEAIHTDAWL